LRIPKKKELLELQKKYRTDKKIGDAYGVPARLVAYWRTKKKINAYSFPKYTEEKIRELWERFGDDSRAGEELSISKAGFRQWRRKYQIENKPLQLRLEQLELQLPDANRRKGARHETIAQKILAKKSGLKRVEPGEVINIEPDLAVSHGNTGQIIRQFIQLGVERIWDPSKIVITLDQKPRDNRGEAPSHRMVREFVKKQKIKHFFDVDQGINSQLIFENALILPGQLALSSGSHSLCAGSLGALSIGLTPAELAVIWATGKIWLRVPETIKVSLNGRLTRGVYAKDIMLEVTRELSKVGVEYKSIEFYGNALSALTVSERFTLTCLSSGLGIKAAIVPLDDPATRYLRRIVKTKFTPIHADSDTVYSDELEFDITRLVPQASLLNGTLSAQPVEDLPNKKIEQVVIGCCANGRIDDLEIAARMIRGHHIAQDVRMMVIPGSRKVLLEAMERGYVKTFLDSGCMVMNPGCGQCFDAHDGFLEAGERAVTTAGCARVKNANFSEAEIYQVSTATAVATALEGSITDPRRFLK
jgi:3-isopropylmalate/(R)-2-methylmalate dehydratase large subunit